LFKAKNTNISYFYDVRIRNSIKISNNEAFKTFLVLSFLVSLTLSSSAQDNSLISYSAGANISTNGLGLDLSAGLAPNKLSNKNSIRITVNTLHHPQETKVQNQTRANPKAYVFGKLNAAGVIRLSYDFNYAIGQPKLGSPSLQYGFSVGPNLGLLKPYYVGFEDPETQPEKPQIIQQSEYTNEYQNYIYGPASWTHGLLEIDPRLGINLDMHFTVRWNNSFHFKEWKSGIRADYFPNNFKILYNSDKRVFASLYTSYSIGRY
jgi:hypothetical protein